MVNLDNMGNLANLDTVDNTANIGRVSVWTESEMGSEPILVAVLQCQANSRRGRSKLLDPIPLQKSVFLAPRKEFLPLRARFSKQDTVFAFKTFSRLHYIEN
jgi:hypothetical protein